jgi:membrane-associated protein
MRYSTFVRYNIVGGLIWGVGVTTLGYFLGEIDFIKNNLEVAALIVVAISVLPIAYEFWKHRREVAHAAEVAAAALIED